MSGGKFLGLLGYAEIEVTGRYPEKFINLATAHGVRMWDTEIRDGYLMFRTDIYSVKKLWEVEAKTGCKLSIKNKAGLFVLGQFLLKRRFLVVGFFCFWVVLYYISGMVWKINISGTENLSSQQILEFVEPLGLYQGARHRQLELNQIEKKIYIAFPEVAWIAIDRSGTYINIRVVEKEYDPLQFGEVIDIVAEYDGIIFEMMVLQGVAMVEPGMTVAQGDVLIAGYRDVNGAVNAAGSAKARVYIEGYGDAGLQETEQRPTGNEKEIRLLQLGNSTTIGLSSREHGFSTFSVQESVRNLRGSSRIPIKLITRTVKELETVTYKYTPEQAKELAVERAAKAAIDQVEEHADIIKEEVVDLTLESEVYRFKVLLTVETNIAMEKVQEKGD